MELSGIESKSKFTKDSSENSLECKSENFDDHKNGSFPIFKKIKSKYPKNLFFGRLDVNFIRNKLESVQEMIQNTFDICLVCVTNIDCCFPNQWLLFYVNQDFTWKMFSKYPMRQDLEILVLELKLSNYWNLCTSITNWYCI